MESNQTSMRDNIASFIEQNYPHLLQCASQTKWLSGNGMLLSVVEDRLLHLDGRVYLAWAVQFSDPTRCHSTLDTLKDFMSTFMCKPICDPDFKDDGVYDSGENSYVGRYTRCWFVPEFPNGHTESGILLT